MSRELVLDPTPIGVGAYGKVYATTQGSSQLVVKFMSMPQRDDEEGLMQVVRELRALRLFSHPNVLKSHGVVWDGGMVIGLLTPHYDMTLQSLDTTHCNGIRRNIVCSVASALSHVHAHGCVHCDVKPQNIFIRLKENVVVLGDFGLLQPRRFTKIPQASYVVTRWYRPPEITFLPTGDDDGYRYDGVVDMWSLGCVLVEMISKKPLFQPDGNASLKTCLRLAYNLPSGIDSYGALCKWCNDDSATIRKYLETFFEATEYGEPSEQEWKWLSQLLVFDADRRSTSSTICGNESSYADTFWKQYQSVEDEISRNCIYTTTPSATKLIV